MRESSPEPCRERSPVLSIGVMKACGWEYYAREVADGLEDYYRGRGRSAGCVDRSRRDRSRCRRHGALPRRWRCAFGEARHPRDRRTARVVRGGPTV